MEKPRRERNDKFTVVHRGTLRDIVLRVLAEGPAHGYEIIRRIKIITDNEWRPSAGTLYPLLSQLEEEGLIEVSSIDENKVRGGKRIKYKLTDKGWNYLMEKMRRTADTGLRIFQNLVANYITVLEKRNMNEEAKSLCKIICQRIKDLSKVIIGECGIDPLSRSCEGS